MSGLNGSRIQYTPVKPLDLCLNKNELDWFDAFGNQRISIVFSTIKWRLWEQNARNKSFVNVCCRRVGTFIRKTTNIRTDISYENFSELNKKNKISERRIIYIKQIKLERNYEQKKLFFRATTTRTWHGNTFFVRLFMSCRDRGKKTCVRGREARRSARKNNCAATMFAASILGFIFYIICPSRPRVPLVGSL